jgi:hypothetical protein
MPLLVASTLVKYVQARQVLTRVEPLMGHTCGWLQALPPKYSTSCFLTIMGAPINYTEYLVSYLQNFIFCLTYKWAQLARVFVPFKPCYRNEYDTSLFGPFINYGESVCEFGP